MKATHRDGLWDWRDGEDFASPDRSVGGTRSVDARQAIEILLVPTRTGDPSVAASAAPLSAPSPAPGDPEYISLIDSGSSTNRVDIWYVGDGYLASQRQELIDDITAQFNDMTANPGLNDPFARYRNFFNVHIAFKASNEQGADKPENGISVDTAFDASYSWGGGPERLLYFSDSKANSAVNAVRPSTVDIDMRFGIVNETQYGGGGGFYGVFAGKNSSAYEVALHEIGHSYVGLADEYWTNGTTYSGGEPSQKNVTTDPTGAKWAHWAGFNDGVLGPIGAYQGGLYTELGVYRPTQNSKMRELDRPFDAIAREEFILKFYDEVDPLDDYYQPTNNGIIVNPQSLWGDVIDPAIISTKWLVNGVEQTGVTGEAIDPSILGLADGTYTITLRAIDETPLVRINLDKLKQDVSWEIGVAETDFPATGFDDIVFGTDAGNVIAALGGADTIEGGLGNDFIDGGDGDDLLFGDTDATAPPPDTDGFGG